MFNLCLPAKIYVILTVLSIILHLGNIHYRPNPKEQRNRSRSSPYSLSAICSKMVLMVIWAALLNWLCNTGHTTLAWIIFLFPLIVIFLIYTLVISNMVLTGVRK